MAETGTTNPTGAAKTSVGAILGDTFSAMGKKPFLFVVLGVSIAVAVTAIGLWMPSFALRSWVVGALTIILSFACEGAVCLAVYRLRNGQPISLGDCVAQTMRRIVPVIGIVVIFLVIAALLFMLSSLLFGGASLGSWLVLMPGIPLLFLYCIWFAALPICVVENRGMIESLSRSAELTSGFRWQVFGSWLVCQFMTGAFAFAVMYLVAASRAFSPMTIYWVENFVAYVPGILINILIASTYFNLRSAREGIGLAGLATVFE